MAVTFRDFFQGVADGMPKAAEMMYQYNMFVLEQDFKNRQLDLQEKDVESNIAYRKAATSRADQLLPAQIDELESSVRLNELDIEVAELSKTMKQGKIDDIDRYFKETGETPNFARIRQELDNLKGINKKQILDYDTAELQYEALKDEQTINRLETIVSTAGFIGSMATSPEFVEPLTKIWNDTGGDPNAFMAAVLESPMSLQSPETVDSIRRMTELMVTYKVNLLNTRQAASQAGFQNEMAVWSEENPGKIMSIDEQGAVRMKHDAINLVNEPIDVSALVQESTRTILGERAAVELPALGLDPGGDTDGGEQGVGRYKNLGRFGETLTPSLDPIRGGVGHTANILDAIIGGFYGDSTLAETVYPVERREAHKETDKINLDLKNPFKSDPEKHDENDLINIDLNKYFTVGGAD